VPLTRGHGNGVALQFEIELTQLDQLDQFRNRGIGSREETGNWMQAFSEVLTAPPASANVAVRSLGHLRAAIIPRALSLLRHHGQRCGDRWRG
jgi:hypothetical protein